MKKIKIKMEKGAQLSKYYEEDTGVDLHVYKFCKTYKEKGARVIVYMKLDNYTINPGRSVLIDTGISGQWSDIPKNENELTDLQIRPKSGLTLDGIVAQFGTIDENYRGNIYVTLFNFSNFQHTFRIGDKIAQMVFAKATKVNKNDFEITENLNETSRNTKGHGSTGK